MQAFRTGYVRSCIPTPQSVLGCMPFLVPSRTGNVFKKPQNRIVNTAQFILCSVNDRTRRTPTVDEVLQLCCVFVGFVYSYI